MGYEESFKQFLDVGPGGVMTRPDLIYDMMLCLCGKQEEFGRELRGQNEQLNNAKRAINLVYKQQNTGEGERGQSATPSQAEDPPVRQLSDRIDRLDRMHDITAERVTVNQELVSKLQSGIDGVARGKNDQYLKFETKMSELNSLVVHHKQVLMQLEHKVRSLEDDTATTANEPQYVTQPALEDAISTVDTRSRHLEKKLIAAVTEVAERTDRQQTRDDDVLLARMREVEKAISNRSKQIDDIQALWELQPQDVRWAVEGTVEDRVKVLHATPAVSSIIIAMGKMKSMGTAEQRKPIQTETVAAAPVTPAPVVSTQPQTILRQQVQSERLHQDQEEPYPVVGLEIVDGPGPGTGVRVVSVLPGSPAVQAGINAGDRLLSFNGHPTDTRSAFMSATLQCQPNTTVSLQRIGPASSTVQHVHLTLGSSAGTAPQNLRPAKRAPPPQQDSNPWR